jgi:NADH dehydrogenase
MARHHSHVLLLTGATGLVGSALLRRLTARGEPVRCLVRDPRRLGPERVRVQITIGDLTDPRAHRQALRGARTVVHLAASPRDQPHATIEELAGLATWRLLRAAEQAGIDHFVFFSALGASPSHRSRLHRAKAIAEQAVEAADLRTTTFAPSFVYSPGDRRLARLEHLAWLPAVPLAGRGRARTQPIWADDVADCVIAALDRPPGEEPHRRYELAGPDELSHREIAELTLRAAQRRRWLVPVPAPVLRPLLRAYEALAGPTAMATWEEAEMLGVTMRTKRGTADAEALGVRPRALAAVLGA